MEDRSRTGSVSLDRNDYSGMRVHGGRTIGDAPSRDGSRCAALIPSRSHVGCHQLEPCVWEGRHMKNQEYGNLH